MTIFKKILDGAIPTQKIYEDDHCIAFKDIHPQAPVHILIIPRKEIPTLADAKPEDQALLGHLMIKTTEIARQLGIEEQGYRVVINCRQHGGQEVAHLHIHLLAGRQLKWPPG